MTDPDRPALPSVQQRDVLRAAANSVLDTPPGALRDAAMRFAVYAAQAVILDGCERSDVARAMGIEPDTLTDWIDHSRDPKPPVRTPPPRREHLSIQPPPTPMLNRSTASISQHATIEQHADAYATFTQTQDDGVRPRTVWSMLYLSGDSRKCQNAFDVEAGDLRELIDPAPQFRWEERVSVRSGAIATEMEHHRPDLLHLSGHQEHNALLLTEMARNTWQLIDIGVVVDQLTRHRPPMLTTLNVCDSVDFAKRLIDHAVVTVIAWDGELNDNDAARFNRHFYYHLILGRTVADALAAAHDATAWEGCTPKIFGSPMLRFLQ